MAYLQRQQFGELGKLRISFRHPFGKKSIFGKTVRVVGKVAKVALPIAAGGLALKFAVPFIGKKVGGLFRRRPPGIPPAPSITPPSPDQLPAAPATVAETAAMVGAQTLLQNAGILPGAPPASYTYATPAAAAPGVPDGTEAPTAPAENATVTGPMQAGMLGGMDSKTLLIISAVGLGALMLSKRRR
jgi:hypothetical protein